MAKNDHAPCDGTAANNFARQGILKIYIAYSNQIFTLKAELQMGQNGTR